METLLAHHRHIGFTIVLTSSRCSEPGRTLHCPRRHSIISFESARRQNDPPYVRYFCSGKATSWCSANGMSPPAPRVRTRSASTKMPQDSSMRKQNDERVHLGTSQKRRKSGMEADIFDEHAVRNTRLKSSPYVSSAEFACSSVNDTIRIQNYSIYLLLESGQSLDVAFNNEGHRLPTSPRTWTKRNFMSQPPRLLTEAVKRSSRHGQMKTTQTHAPNSKQQ